MTDRRHGLGGSEIAAALGLDPRKTPLDVWRAKLLGEDPIDSPALRRGKFLEPAIIRRVLGGQPHQTQVELQRDGWLFGHVDALAGRKVVEVKTLSRRMWESEWGEPGTDDVPERALCQTLLYGDLADAECSEIVAAVIPDDPDKVLGLDADEVASICDVHVYPIGRSPDVEAMIVERAFKFWHVYVRHEQPPPRVDLADACKLFRHHVAGRFVEATQQDVELLLRREQLKAAGKTLAAEMERVEFALAERIGSAEGLHVPHIGPIVTWRSQKRGAYTVEPSEFRVFRTTKWWNRLQSDQPKAAETLTAANNKELQQ